MLDAAVMDERTASECSRTCQTSADTHGVSFDMVLTSNHRASVGGKILDQLRPNVNDHLPFSCPKPDPGFALFFPDVATLLYVFVHGESHLRENTSVSMFRKGPA